MWSYGYPDAANIGNFIGLNTVHGIVSGLLESILNLTVTEPIYYNKVEGQLTILVYKGIFYKPISIVFYTLTVLLLASILIIF